MSNLTPIPNHQPQNLQHGKNEGQSKVRLLRLADSERKIGASTEEQVKSVLKYIFVLLGFNEKDVPDDYEKAVILNYIFNNYGHQYSCQDLKNAFEMGIANVFPVDKEIYGKRFSPLYISRFMDAYTEYKIQMARQYKEKPEPPQLPPKQEITTEEQEERIFKVIQRYVEEHQKIPPIYDVVSCYNTLVRYGKIEPTEELNEQKRQTAIQIHNMELNKELFSMSPVERKNRKAEFKKSDNLDMEVKRAYLLDYWAKCLTVAR